MRRRNISNGFRHASARLRSRGRRLIAMNFGFNSNVRVGSALYHVQTEDRGPSHPFLDTVVYEAGLVVHKRSTSYQDLAGSAAEGEGLAQQLHERLAQQHREVIAQLEAGTLHLKALADAPLQRLRWPRTRVLTFVC